MHSNEWCIIRDILDSSILEYNIIKKISIEKFVDQIVKWYFKYLQ